MRALLRPYGTVGGSVPKNGLTPFPHPLAGSSLAAGAFVLALVGALCAAGARAQEPEAADEPVADVSETLTVTATRLRDRPAPERQVPAHVTTLEREEIEAGQGPTLQDRLAIEAGVILFDQVGDDVAKTLDLRGFRGSGTRVFLNGAPINDPRNNSLSLELVPVRALDRVEITRGSTAALAGGGSEAGVINLWTRRGEAFGGSLEAGVGGYGSLEAGGAVGDRVGRIDLFAAGGIYETDGFRDNADGHLERLAGDAGWDLGDDGRLALSVVHGSADFGNPGALTIAEAADDRRQAPFNALDFTDQRFTQAELNFERVLSPAWSLTANAFGRDRGSQALTTGRAAPDFGGFFLAADTSVVGSAAQLTGSAPESGHQLSLGLEWLDGETDARGFSTPPSDPGVVDPGLLASDNVTERRTFALYAQDRWQLARRASLTVGARWDEDEVGFAERFPDPSLVAEREFSELSLRAGLAWTFSDRQDVYVAFGEAFLPPTVEELFAFPLFGSNPGLEPEDSRSLELGYRGRWRGGRNLDVALFDIRTEDEIIFDPDSPLGLFGANVNAGEARRRGLEVALHSPLGARANAFVQATLMDPEAAAGANEGNTLPLVPEERLALGIDAHLGLRLALRVVGLYVGDQVLDNDDANTAPELDAYTVVDARLSWRPSASGGLSLYLEARNLLDEEYATRGIFAFDFASLENRVFLTPAPERRVLGGVEWSF